MKNKIYKSLLALFLVISLCTLTACGHGGGGSKTPTPQAISELTAVRLAVSSIANNITGIIGYTPSSSRANTSNISVSDKMKSLAYGKEINKIIPAKTADEFKKGLGPNNEEGWIKTDGTNKDSNNILIIGSCDKYEQGVTYNAALYEGKEGKGTILTKVVALPSENTAVAVSYLNDGNGNQSTFVFVINKKGEFEGKTFDGTKDNVTYNSEGFSSNVYGNNKQLTYANDEVIETVDLSNGTSVNSSTPLIEGFKQCLYALKFSGQLRTGSDHQSNSAKITENILNQLPQDLKYIGNGGKLNKYMNYSTIEDFGKDSDIINKFMPNDLEDYEDVRIGDYNGSLDYYDGPTATATLRLALSVINKDNAKIITKVAGQDDGLFIVSISYLTVGGKDYTVAVGAQMIVDSEGIFLEAKLFEGKQDKVNYQTTDGAIGTAKVEYKSESEIPVTITVNGKTLTYNAASDK